MKKVLIIVGVLMALVSCAKVPVGHKGLKVYNLQEGKIEVKSVGNHFMQPSQDMYVFPVFTQTHSWIDSDGIFFQSKEGLQLSADISIAYNFQSDKVEQLFTKYRQGADEIRDIVLKNLVKEYINRQSVNYSVEELLGDKKTKLIDDVLLAVKDDKNLIGINVERVSLVSNIRVPEQVAKAINEKMTKKQNAEAIKTEAEAMADAVLTKAKADAEANRMINASLNGNLLKLKELEKWDGKMPQVVGSSTMVSLGK